VAILEREIAAILYFTIIVTIKQICAPSCISLPLAQGGQPGLQEELNLKGWHVGATDTRPILYELFIRNSSTHNQK